MSPQRFALLATLCGTLVLAGWVAAGLAGIGSTGIENSGEPIEDKQATSVAAQAEHVEGPRATAMASVATVATSHLTQPEPAVAPGTVAAGDAATADPATAELGINPVRPCVRDQVRWRIGAGRSEHAQRCRPRRGCFSRRGACG